MREILFRGKAINRDPNRAYRTDYKNGDWVFGLLSKFDKYGAEMTNEDGISGIDVDSKTVGEYTGLTDKNGKKIFEGDIVKVKTRKTETMCVVVFLEGWFIGITEDDGECEFRYMVGVEIIGNIHDNPELLK